MMSPLEDLKPDASVKGILPNGLVTVVSVQWHGSEALEASTPYVWIIGRTKTDGPTDYEAVHKIQAGYKITPLSQWGKEPVPPEVKIDPSIDMKTPPKATVDTMKAGPFFAYAAELLKLHPPHFTDQPIIAQLKRLGFEVGKSFDLDKADSAVKKGLEKGQRLRRN